jgi:hypothetical protein
MDNNRFLQKLFDGYVSCYRQHNWHMSSNYSDITSAELAFFTQLGRGLGFVTRREMNWDYPRDLCWCERTGGKSDADAGTELYLERENDDKRVLTTIEKMTNPENAPTVPLLVAVFGWVRPATLQRAKRLTWERLRDGQKLLMISWIGDTQDGAGFSLEGWILADGVATRRDAAPHVDKAGYWYAELGKPWEADTAAMS